MASEKNKSSVRSFTKFISTSSQKLLAAFLNDDLKLEKEQEALREQIHQACSQDSFVVLQIHASADPSSPFETVSGKLRFNKNNPNIFILAEQATQKIRMVPIEDIRKVSFIKSRVEPKKGSHLKTL